MRALIVDDDRSMSRLIRRCLSLWGWDSDESDSVSAALKLFKRGRYDLALCDVNLPDGDGVFLACALSDVKPALRIVILSGDPRSVDRARAAGFNGCLHKPFDLSELKALIDREDRTVVDNSSSGPDRA
jgi:DNA-binding response OmpR family regulator